MQTQNGRRYKAIIDGWSSREADFYNMKRKFSVQQIPWKARWGYSSGKVVSGTSTRRSQESDIHDGLRENRAINYPSWEKWSESGTYETLTRESHLTSSRRYIHLCESTYANIHPLYLFFSLESKVHPVLELRMALLVCIVSQMSSLSWKALAYTGTYCFPAYYDEWVRWAERYEFCWTKMEENWIVPTYFRREWNKKLRIPPCLPNILNYYWNAA